ncbi:MAG: flagellar filament capping protein FliD [Lachnospiraceae bacterium]
MPIRITGMNSGLDTEALVQEMVSAYSTKKDKYVKAQTKLGWKQEKWKSLNTKVKSFHSTISNLRFSSAYSLKTAVVSDTTKAKVTASGTAPNGVQSLQITKLAKSGYLTGAKMKQADGSEVKESTKLSDLGFDTEGTVTLKSGDTTTDIKVTKDMTVKEFVSALKDGGVNASFDEKNQRMYISAKKTGTANDFTLAGKDGAGIAALQKMGLTVDDSYYESLVQFAVSADGSKLSPGADGKYQYGDTEKAATKAYVREQLLKADAAKTAKQDAEAAKTLAEAQKKYAQNYQTAIEGVGGDAQKLQKYQSLIQNDVYKDDAGNQYYVTKDDAGNQIALKEDKDGNVSEVTNLDLDADEITIGGAKVEKLSSTENAEAQKAILEKIPEDVDKSAFTSAVKTIDLMEKQAEATDPLVTKDFIKDVKGMTSDALAAKLTELDQTISEQTTKIEEQQKILDATSAIYRTSMDMTKIDDPDGPLEEAMTNIEMAVTYLNATHDPNSDVEGAKRIEASDAEIYLNGAQYISDTNDFTINGLSITAMAVTGSSYDPDEKNAISINTETDTQGIYDKVKDFLTQYNEIINEMTSLYNADSAKGYEPLTDDEKSEMSDKEVEKWEEKIKASLLRRDTNLNTIMNAMQTAMSKSYTLSNGQSYNFTSFGIHTLGYLNADKNEQNAYHIDGDEDDSSVSSNDDKLMAAIKEDPDSVIEFMKQAVTGVYQAISDQMKGTSLRSSQTIYNDKEMDKEYKNYTTTIKEWEDKISDMEDAYYKKFAAMESALAKLQSNSSALSGLLG